MTRRDYTDYEGRVARYLEGVEHVSTGPRPDCPQCEDCRVADTEEYHEDPWFSNNPCEICQGPAGNRVSWHGVILGQVAHGSCCQDCEVYLNYGRLDDTTMLAIQDDTETTP